MVANLMHDLPCPTFGCPPSAYLQSERVDALTVNGLVSLDRRGIFYLMGGAGHYQLTDINVPGGEGHFGISAGAGVAVPLVGQLRAVAEARWHDLFGTRNTNGPTSFIPFTVSLRFP
jgi:hypothetical protein